MGDSLVGEPLPFDEALAAYEQAYTTLFASLLDYPPHRQRQSGACGDWSPQQVIMHLAGWLIEAQRRFRRYPATGQVQYNVDVFNDVSVWDRETQRWEQSVAECQREYEKLLAMAQTLKAYQIERERRYAEWLTALANQARHHGAQLEAFRA